MRFWAYDYLTNGQYPVYKVVICPEPHKRYVNTQNNWLAYAQNVCGKTDTDE